MRKQNENATQVTAKQINKWCCVYVGSHGYFDVRCFIYNYIMEYFCYRDIEILITDFYK